MRTAVKDVMTRRVTTVREHTPFREIAEVLVANGISATPVVDGDDRVVGVVSEGDLMRKEEFREQYSGESYRPSWRSRLRWWKAGQHAEGARKAAGNTAAGLMDAPAVTVSPFASISRAARLMDEHGVKRLVVVDDQGRAAGIVSRRDLLKMYLRDDDEIRRRVVEGIPSHARWDDRYGIIVEVRDGIVTLSGQADRRSEAMAAVRTAGRVEGVVDVRRELTWREDDLVTLPVTWDRP
ncbi:CBS domain-containing protein [Nonomuraea zeae]|uniref:CBS domain-containing protein n=2 Tax=Nonomuraea zeae TaxID=1642303 RepID=A0A5S4GSE0_9ACTN|nr:CBS domain-containing protein [Nonomuraea zeae]TMR35817.1 CBS domain-containing protein [Nonomuraea zeae]